jgi:hypothetical protein
MSMIVQEKSFQGGDPQGTPARKLLVSYFPVDMTPVSFQINTALTVLWC